MEVPKCLRGNQEGSRESQSYRFAEHTQLHPSEKVSEVELDNIQGKYHVCLSSSSPDTWVWLGSVGSEFLL